MLPAGLSELEAALRRAVAAGSYHEAGDLLSSYSAEAERAIVNSASGEEARVLAARVSGLLQWALRAVRAGRAQGRLESSMIATARRYGTSRPGTATLRLDA